MSAMKITTSAKYFNKKCDEFKEERNKRLLDQKNQDDDALSVALQSSVAHQEQIQGRASCSMEDPCDREPCCLLSAGSHFIVDNFDIFQKVREMTEEQQNKDFHWVNHSKVENRVLANHLSNEKRVSDLDQIDNSKLIPSLSDNDAQRRDYITLVERILVDSLPYLSFCKDVVTSHIPHLHSKESAMKSNKVSLC